MDSASREKSGMAQAASNPPRAISPTRDSHTDNVLGGKSYRLASQSTSGPRHAELGPEGQIYPWNHASSIVPDREQKASACARVNSNAALTDDEEDAPPGRRAKRSVRVDDTESVKEARPAKPPLLRSKSEMAHAAHHDIHEDEDSVGEVQFDGGARHGFEDHYQSEETIKQLANNWYMYFTDKRHETTGKPKSPGFQVQDWRMRDRLKTVSAALAVCLNIGVEPPDQLRTVPGAKLEAWQDPTLPKALEKIGKSLQAQYETLAIRTRYKQYLDPSVEETKRFCISLRRNAKDERVLFHYNGHGVPKPTSSGEIWVFNKNYTQYIPVSQYDLQQWLQAPSICVWDCSEGGNVLSNYHRQADKHEQEEMDRENADPTYEKANYRPYIHLAACASGENLPTNPQLPADVFTCCLTTPIEMALWFFVLRNPLKSKLTPEQAKKLPGRLQERRTPLGELNWIFTAITDTIAWTTFPRNLFRKFFRQDLMVAALFRNFLLAQRIMSVYNCHPQSYPELPDTRQHRLWDSWDLAVDTALQQLPGLPNKEDAQGEYGYVSSPFFTEQLTAFEVYLTRGDAMEQKPPEQLPVVLQVLLSQQHRVRALILLGRFLDLGPWAVQLALSIGIFPYVLKLLQSAATELKPIMVFIWTRVLAVDTSCQTDLIKDSGYTYFVSILEPKVPLPVVDVEEHKAMCAFILAVLCKNYKPGRLVCSNTETMRYCLTLVLERHNDLLRQWCCLCISQLWSDFPDAKWRGVREGAHTKLPLLARDPCPEVRAAMVFAMTTFLGIPEQTPEVTRLEEELAIKMLDLARDGSPLVRKEVVVFLSTFVKRHENKFIVAAYEQLSEDRVHLARAHQSGRGKLRAHDAVANGFSHGDSLQYGRDVVYDLQDGPEGFGISHGSVYAACWKHICTLSVDPHPEVQRDATIMTDNIHHALLQSPVSGRAQDLMDEIFRRAKRVSRGTMSQRNGAVGSKAAAAPSSSSTGILQRTASFLFGNRLLGGGGGGAGGDHLNGNAAVEQERETRARPRTPPQLPPSSGRVVPLQRAMTTRSLRRGADPTLGQVPRAEAAEPTQASLPSRYHVANEPCCPGYHERNPSEVSTLPLKSTFLEWSVEYFREPQMRPAEPDEPGSKEYNERLWRRSCNEGVLHRTQPLKTHAGSHRWNQAVGNVSVGAQTTRMSFHQFENHVALADDANTIYVYDWKTPQRMSRFSNGNPEGSVIADIRFINEDDQAMLLSGSSDGVVRIYRKYEHEESVELASSWRALIRMAPSPASAGMVFDWEQVNGNLLVAGDERIIRIWNAGYEMCTHEIPARSGSCVTSLTADQMTGNIFVAGFGDGAVRVFDTRLNPRDAMVRRWKDDCKQWVRSVHMQRGGRRELVSAHRNGKVRLWDIRFGDAPLKAFQTTNDVLRTASVHEHLPVFAVGTSAHVVKVFNFDGYQLSRVEPHSSFLQGHKGAPISVTAFHPHHMLLGCAAQADTHFNLFACGDERVRLPSHTELHTPA